MKNSVNVMDLVVGNVQYKAIPIELARAIEVMLAPYEDGKVKAETPKVEPKKTVERTKVYALCEDGKSVTIGGDGFIPTKVFKGVTYSLKQSGAKYDAKTKAWTFENKTKCKAWCKAQDARG